MDAPSPGRCFGSGRWRPAARTIRWALVRHPAGRLFRSDDGGTSWELVRSLWDHPKRREWFGGGADYPGIHSICVEPGNSRRVTIGVSCGGVWVTEDRGATWTCRAEGCGPRTCRPSGSTIPTSRTRTAWSSAAGKPQMLWASHHNGVFRTADGAKTWQEVQPQPSSFGFAVAVHPQEPGDGLARPGGERPAKDSIRRASGGIADPRWWQELYCADSWLAATERLRYYLPPRPRHRRHRRALALGSTTGNLWVSVDQGDTWQTVAEHLPPVYAVRWVGR